MSIETRIGALEQQEERDEHAAIAHFAAWWDAWARDPETVASDEASLAAARPPGGGAGASRPTAGYTGSTVAELDAFFAARMTPEKLARGEHLWAVVEGTTQRPDDTAAIRAALAALAPDLGLTAQDRPAATLRALKAAIVLAAGREDDIPSGQGGAGRAGTHEGGGA